MTTVSTNDTHQDAPRDVEERVLKVIALTKRLPREAVTLDSSFESLGVDSLDRLNILFDLESEFDIQINDEDAKRVENIPQMVAGVQSLLDDKTRISSEQAMQQAVTTASNPSGGDASLDPAPVVTKPASSGE